MAVYTLRQIYQMAVNAGFAPGQEAAKATAIAWGESSGNDMAVNYNNKAPGVSTDYGLMQVNSHYWPQLNPSSLMGDAQGSMNAAYNIYKQGGWGQWLSTSDGNGAYAAALPKANAIANEGGVTPQGGTGNSASGNGGSLDPGNGSLTGDTSSYPFDISHFSVNGVNTPSDTATGGATTYPAAGTPVNVTGELPTAVAATGKGIDTAIGAFGDTLAKSAAGVTNSAETWLGQGFTIFALVVLGLIMVGGGLLLFASHSVDVKSLATKV